MTGGPTDGPRDDAGRGGGSRGGPGLRSARLFALFALALALFNFPLLLVWDQPVTVFGLPLLGVALFVIWAGLIVALALVSEGRGSGRNPTRRSAPGSAPQDWTPDGSAPTRRRG